MHLRRYSVELFITAILLIALFYPSSDQPSTPALTEEGAASLEIKLPNISEEAIQRGLTFIHSEKSGGISDLIDALGAGACILDFNGDSYMDVFFVPGSRSKRYYGRDAWWQPTSSSSLFINDQFGYFKPINTAINQLSDQPGMGCTVADFDKDGDPDIAVSFIGSVQILWNDRREKLIAETVYSEDGYWPTSLSASDIDRDGLTDLYISGYLKYDKTNKTFEDKMSFDTSEKFRFSANLYPGSRNVTLLNLGSAFQHSSNPIAQFSDSRTLQGSTTTLLEKDHAAFILANDAGSVSQISPPNSPPYYQTNTPLKSNTFISYKTDETLLIFGTERGHLPKLFQIPFSNQDLARTLITTTTRSLQENNFGTIGADINNDGLTDIIFANGYPTPDSDAKGATQGQRNSALLQLPDGKFQTYLPAFTPRYSSRSVVRVDIDNDGDHDILFTSNNNLPELWINNSSVSNWIGVSGLLSGDIVTLHTNKNLYNYAFTNEGFLSASSPRLTFHLKPDELVSSLIIQRGGVELAVKHPTARAYNDLLGNSYPPSPKKDLTSLAAHETMWRSLAGETTSQLSRHFALLDTKSKTSWIKLSRELQLSMRYQVLAQALRDSFSDVRFEAIKELSQVRTDETTQMLALALEKASSSAEICEISSAFQKIFETEEANINSKNLGVTSLIKATASHAEPCLIYALSKSRSKRAAVTLSRIADSDKNSEISQIAMAALKNLRLDGNFETSQVNRILTKSTPHKKNASSPKAATTVRQLLEQISNKNISPEGRIASISDLQLKSPAHAQKVIRKMLTTSTATEQNIALRSIKPGNEAQFTDHIKYIFSEPDTSEPNHILAGYLLAKSSPSYLLSKLNHESKQ